MNKRMNFLLNISILIFAAVIISAFDIPEIDLCYIPCPREVKPLCGSDGVTYQNACYFGVAKCKSYELKIIGKGTCKSLEYTPEEKNETSILNNLSTIKNKVPENINTEVLSNSEIETSTITMSPVITTINVSELAEATVKNILNARALGASVVPSVGNVPQVIKTATTSINANSSPLSSNVAIAKGVGLGVGKLAQATIGKNISTNISSPNLIKGKNPISNGRTSELSNSIKNGLQISKNTNLIASINPMENIGLTSTTTATTNFDENEDENNEEIEVIYDENDEDDEDEIYEDNNNENESSPNRNLQKLSLDESLKLPGNIGEAVKQSQFQLPNFQGEGSKLQNINNIGKPGVNSIPNAKFLTDKSLSVKSDDLNKSVKASKNLELKGVKLPSLFTLKPNNESSSTTESVFENSELKDGIKGFGAIGLDGFGKKIINPSDSTPSLLKIGDSKKFDKNLRTDGNLSSQLSESLGKIGLDKQKNSPLMRGIRS